MEAILILFIISVQFGIIFFSVKKLTELELKIINLTNSVDNFSGKVKPAFEQLRSVLQKINLGFEKFYKHKNKLKMYRNLMLAKSLLVMIILYKKRKSLLSFFSVYGIVNKFTKALMVV